MGQDDPVRLAKSNAVPNEAQNVQEETLPATEALTAATPALPDAEDVARCQCKKSVGEESQLHKKRN
ncbi:hypothetical protein PF010_g12814 [Phytophthora fragariae]|uniref:Uncharacterized protein n=1 Tax=Phytophthora fragariae TaxID=53985 RepID=A0A6A3J932_9STRA|nr:hypothetical protein PF011_g19340 [Phytophthora fragariae]KAE9105918.1 hypothetical protein PF010_g12814 [Phytophthora fragariae]KAE9206976.1 hypothetical protein PF004_g17149 [Phytophthora fragariae]KAE9310887.1 hypothetical protein PF008_g20342 [Phytophthora fragariae]